MKLPWRRGWSLCVPVAVADGGSAAPESHAPPIRESTVMEKRM